MQDSETAREPGRSRLSGFAKTLIILAVLAVLLFFLMVAAVAGMIGRVSPDDDSGPHLVQLNVEGPIYDAEPVLAILERLRKDEQCKGVLLRVESPGGAVGSSQEIYASLSALRARGVPLAVSFGNIAASGGYYIALAGERIFANPGSLTGSIGVIFQFPEVEKLMEKAGVSLQTVKSGALKDVGNPARKATPEEILYLQNVIDDTYDQFVGDVARARGLDRDSLRRLADGRVFTGRQALAAGLVDTLGGLEDARAWLVARAGVDEDIDWKREPRPRSRLDEFLSPEANTPMGGIGGWLSGMRHRLNPGAFYMWP
jgi:protease-4